MLSFVNNWFAPKSNPIGVDFGTDSLRMAQVRSIDGEHQLIAAASADVPIHLRSDPQARLEFFVDAVRDLLAQGQFQGRQAVLCLPPAQMYIQHLRLPRMDDAALTKALPWEVRGKLPIEPSTALLRHVVAGEIYADNDPMLEVIVMAAAREMVNQYLAAANRARLDVVGMNVQPKALIDCFTQVFRRKTDQNSTDLFVDIGCNSTRAIIAQAENVLFARTINIGGEHFNRAVAAAMNIDLIDARILRLKLGASPAEAPSSDSGSALASATVCPAALPSGIQSPVQSNDNADRQDNTDDSADNSFALLGSDYLARRMASDPPDLERRKTLLTDDQPSLASVPAPQQAQIAQVNAACSQTMAQLIGELNLCRRYYESTFPNRPVDRLLFVGGQAKQRSLCQLIAQEMQLAAQVGDPMVRMGKTCKIGPESGFDCREPQPAWAIAIGLSMGPALKPAEIHP
ncbi:MAG: pilus assembly protein PilM [Phycisphaerales bacterium]|nr:pilus assembly protein PilM [Phycisphaerales bacterium]